MSRNDLNRRNFHQLTVAALGGLVTGTLAGCEPAKPQGGGPPSAPAAENAAAPAGNAESTSLLLQEPHVCRGLNMCKNQGLSKENDCAGRGTCASVAQHDCSGQNVCKGQGGCGAKPGENDCKGHGGCHVPLMEHAWDTARKNFESAMRAAGKEVGPAPAKT